MVRKTAGEITKKLLYMELVLKLNRFQKKKITRINVQSDLRMNSCEIEFHHQSHVEITF